MCALEQAEKIQLVNEIDRSKGGTFSFAHALIPATLVDGLSGLRSRRLHRKAAEVMESAGSTDYASLAYHFSAAVVDDKAQANYFQAGRQAQIASAFADAERYFRAALDLSPDDAARAPVFAALANSLASQAKYAECMDANMSSIRAYQAVGDFEQVARLYSLAAWRAWHSGDTPRGLAICREGAAVVAEQPDSAGKASLLHETARQSYFNELPAEATALAQQALEIARRLELRGMQIQAMATLALPQGPDESLKTLIQAVELARGFARDDFDADLGLGYSRSLNNLIELLAYHGRYRDSLPYCEEYLRFNQNLGAVELWPLYQTANAHLVLGEFAEIEEYLARYHQILPGLLSPGVIGWQFELLEAGLAYYRGDHAAALQALHRQYAEVESAGDRQQLFNVIHLLLEVELDRTASFTASDWQRVEELIGRLLPVVERGAVSYREGATTYCYAAIVHTGLGRCAEARAALGKAHERIQGTQATSYKHIEIALAEANLAAAEKRWQEAYQAYGRAVDLNRTIGRRWYTARSLAEWAQAYTARGESGDYQQAKALFEQAQALYREMELPLRVAQIEERLVLLP